jgi:hypothetical protein
MKTLITLALAGLLALANAFAASPNMACTLTGKEVKTCCCQQQKNGKFVCKLNGKTLDKCCCTTK